MEDVLSNLPALQAALDAMASRHRVPGAQLSIDDGERTVDLATGVTSCETGVAVTPDTLFQIGSITKVYTSTLMMRLVDQGKVDLDAPVRRYLPSFQLRDEAAAQTITARHLLTHSSGLVGDYFADFGTGTDCLERYVASLKDQEHVHEPGLMFSYSNAGFIVAGRVIEAVCDKPFHEVLSEELLDPLGLHSTTVVAEEMLRYRYAVGHRTTDPGTNGTTNAATPTVPPVVLAPRSGVPAGSRTSASASDVLRFARMHVDNGRGRNGSVYLSEESIGAMRMPTLSCHGTENCRIGLGWLLWDWGGERCLFHNGATINQFAWLIAMPDRPFAVCLLTNSDTGGRLWRDLGGWIFKTFADIEMPGVRKPPAVPVSIDLERYAGTYERLRYRFDVEAKPGHLDLTITAAMLDGSESTQTLELRPIDEQRFYGTADDTERIVTFLEPDEAGRPRYLHSGSRAAPRQLKAS